MSQATSLRARAAIDRAPWKSPLEADGRECPPRPAVDQKRHYNYWGWSHMPFTRHTPFPLRPFIGVEIGHVPRAMLYEMTNSWAALRPKGHGPAQIPEAKSARCSAPSGTVLATILPLVS